MQKVVFLGSAGVYYNHDLKYQFGYSDYFYTCELAIIAKKAKQSSLMKKEIKTKFDFHFDLSKFFYGKTNSINSITNCDLEEKEQEYFKKNAILFENMETFGLSFVCQQLHKEFIAFYSITNLVGKNGSIEWKKNYSQMSYKLQETLLEKL